MTKMLDELFGIDIKEMAEYSYLVHSSSNDFIPDISNRNGFDSGLLPIVTPLANFENNRVDNINEWLEDIRHDGQQTKIIDNSAAKYTGKLCSHLNRTYLVFQCSNIWRLIIRNCSVLLQ